MSNLTCDQAGCTNEAAQKCASCGKVYCIRHIAYLNPSGNVPTFGWTCKSCAQKMVEKTNRSRRFWGWVVLISIACMIVGMSFKIGREIIWVLVVPGVLGTGTAPVVWLVFALLASQRKAFLRKNFPD